MLFILLNKKMQQKRIYDKTLYVWSNQFSPANLFVFIQNHWLWWLRHLEGLACHVRCYSDMAAAVMACPHWSGQSKSEFTVINCPNILRLTTQGLVVCVCLDGLTLSKQLFNFLAVFKCPDILVLILQPGFSLGYELKCVISLANTSFRIGCRWSQPKSKVWSPTIMKISCTTQTN